MASNGKPCLFFNDGKCKKGAACTFVHSKPTRSSKPIAAGTSQSSPSPSGPKICPYFKKGECSWGTKCTRSHEIGSKAGGPKAKKSGADHLKRPPSSGSGSVSSSKGKERQASDAESAKETEEEGGTSATSPWDSPVETTPDAAAGTQKAPCELYNMGYCNEGANCAFSHGDSLRLEITGKVKEKAKSTSQKVENSTKKSVCRHFMKGECTFGDDCNFLHPKTVEAPVTSSTSATHRNATLNDVRNAFDMLAEGKQNDVEAVEVGEVEYDEREPDEKEEEKNEKEEEGFDEEGEEDADAAGPSWYAQAEPPEIHGSQSEKDITEVYENDNVIEDSPAADGDLSSQQLLADNGQEDVYEPDQEEQHWADPVDEAPANYENRWNDHEHHSSLPPNVVNGVGHSGWSTPARPSPPTNPPRPTIEAATYRTATSVQTAPHVPPPVVPAAVLPLRSVQPPPPPPPIMYPHVSEVVPHWSQFADPHANPDIPFCKLYAQGMCAQGELCRFRHSVTIQEYTLLFRDQQPNLWTLHRFQNTSNATATSIGTQAQVSSGAQYIQQPAAVIPAYASGPSYAMYPLPAALLPTASVPVYPPANVLATLPPGINGQVQPTNGADPTPTTNKPSIFAIPCKFWRLGTCHNGDQCPWVHEGPVGTPNSGERQGDNPNTGSNESWGPEPSSTSRPTRVCRFWRNGGGCHSGDQCRFSHDQNDDGYAANVNPSSGALGPDSPVETIEEEKEETKAEWDASSKVEADDNNGWGAAWDDGNNLWGAPHDESGWDAPTKTDEPTRGKTSWDTGNQGARDSRPRAKGQCFDYSTGKCKRGDSCRFAHIEPERKSQNTGGWDIAPDSEVPAKEKEAPKGDVWPPTDSSSSSAPWVTAPPPCSFYLKGICKKKDKCPLSHSDPTPVPSSVGDSGGDQRSAVDQTGQGNGEGRKSEDVERAAGFGEVEDSPRDVWADDHSLTNEHGENKKRICSFYTGPGTCKLGDICRHAHIDPSPSPASQVPDSSVMEEEEVEITQHEDQGDEPDGYPAAEGDPTEPEDHEEPLGLGHAVNDDSVQENSLESDESELEVDQEPIVFEHPEVKKVMMSTVVFFGPDSTPESIETLAESIRLRLSNLPPGTSVEDIQGLVAAFNGTLRLNTLNETQYGTAVEVQFPNAQQASLAFESLHRRDFTPGGSVAIVASLSGSAPLTSTIPGEKLTLKVSWPNPSKSAWSHYSSITIAKQQASQLDGSIIRGRQIKAAFISPRKNQKDSFAIELRNLSPDTTKEDLEPYCKGNTLITLNQSTYAKDPTDNIREELDRFGDNEFFTPPDTGVRDTSFAFVTFRIEAVAFSAMSALNSCNQDFLAGQPLTIRPVHYTCHKISQTLFNILKDKVELLKEKGEKAYTIQYHDIPRSVLIRLSASLENFAVFANVNAELCALLYGQVLSWEDGILWDEYLEAPASATYLEKLQKNMKAHVYRDLRAKCIRVYGTASDQAAAKSQMLKMLSKVHALRHELDIPRQCMRPLVDGRFESLLRQQGENASSKLSFDVFASKLIVRGPAEDFAKVKASLDSMCDSALPTFKSGNCQICHHEPEKAPIKLSCHHAYCTPCLHLAVRNSFGAPLSCIASRRGQYPPGEEPRCSAHIPYTVIHHLLNDADEDSFLRSSFLSHIRDSPDNLFVCPTMDCPAVYKVGREGMTVRCPKCVSDICTYCKTHGHVGLRCTDVK